MFRLQGQQIRIVRCLFGRGSRSQTVSSDGMIFIKFFLLFFTHFYLQLIQDEEQEISLQCSPICNEYSTHPTQVGVCTLGQWCATCGSPTIRLVAFPHMLTFQKISFAKIWPFVFDLQKTSAPCDLACGLIQFS